MRSWLVLPLRGSATADHGTVVLGYPEPHRFDHRIGGDGLIDFAQLNRFRF